MGKLGVECGKDMYYDHGTDGCAFCSQLCYAVDIQGTRSECEAKCPDYLTSTTISPSTYSPWGTTGSPVNSDTLFSIMKNPAFIAFLTVLGFCVVLIACCLLYKKRKWLIKRVKRQDCCGDRTSNQPHVQATGTPAVQPETDCLLFTAGVGFPDMPVRSLTSSSGEHETFLPISR